MTATMPSQVPAAQPDDRGSATIWVLTCCALLLVVGGVVTVRALAVLARHRAESSADLTALAAAGRIGVAADECPTAARVARANGAALRRCSVRLAADGRTGQVQIVVAMAVRLPLVGPRLVLASARAAREPPTAVGGAESYSRVDPLGSEGQIGITLARRTDPARRRPHVEAKSRDRAAEANPDDGDQARHDSG
jgi:secretion/DNA translocation related TadE-like protein